MELEYQKKGNESWIFLKGELKIQTISKAKELLNQIPLDSSSCILDCKDVTDLDTAGIQLLIAWKKRLEEKNIHLTLVNHPPKLISFLDLYGLVGYFGGKIRIPKNISHEFHFQYGKKKGTY